jgi:hypothetical protein
MNDFLIFAVFILISAIPAIMFAIETKKASK